MDLSSIQSALSTYSIGSDSALIDIMNRISAKLDPLMSIKRKVLDVLNGQTVSENADVFVMEDGVGISVSDLCLAISNSTPTIIGSNGEAITIEEVISSISTQSDNAVVALSILEGAKSSNSLADLKLYVESVTGISMAQESVATLWASLVSSIASTGSITGSVSLQNGVLAWISSLLKRIANNDSAYLFVTSASDYTGASAASIFCSLINIPNIVWTTVISAVKVAFAAIYSGVSILLNKTRQGFQNMVTAGSSTAYIKISDSYDLLAIDVPCFQVLFAEDLSDITEYQTDSFKDVNSASATFSQAIVSWFGVSVNDVKSKLLSDYSEGQGFEIQSTYGYLQFFRLSSNWCLRLFINPTAPLSIPQVSGGFSYTPVRYTNTLIDDTTGYRSSSELNESFANLVNSCLTDDPTLKLASDNTQFPNMYNAYSMYEGVRASMIRFSVFLGSLMCRYGYDLSYLDSTAPCDNYSSPSNISQYHARHDYSFLFGAAIDGAGGTSYTGLLSDSTTGAIVSNPSNSDILTMLTYRNSGPNAIYLSDLRTTNPQLRCQLLTMIQVFLFLYCASSYTDISGSSSPSFLLVNTRKVSMGVARYQVYTDAQLVKRFAGYVGGAATVVVLSTLVIASLIVFKRIKKSYNLAIAAASAAQFKMGDALTLNDNVLANSYYDTYRRNNFKARLISLLYGGTAAATGSFASGFMDNVGASNTVSTTELRHLISGE